MKVYCLTDIHGRYDLLMKALPLIPYDAKMIFLGDYIDRGPQSYEVIQTLRDLQGSYRDVIILKGNHEDMMVKAIKRDIRLSEIGLWEINGGTATRASYNNDQDALEFDADWMKDLPTQVIIDNYTFVHAVASSDLQQRIWGRYYESEDTYWDTHVVHGHTPYREPELKRQRTNLDTGAYATGVLTMGILDTGIEGIIETVSITVEN